MPGPCIWPGKRELERYVFTFTKNMYTCTIIYNTNQEIKVEDNHCQLECHYSEEKTCEGDSLSHSHRHRR